VKLSLSLRFGGHPVWPVLPWTPPRSSLLVQCNGSWFGD